MGQLNYTAMNNEDTSKNNNTKNRYPRYCNGNVLTSQDLNESFDFLHEQMKSTRSLLFGQGILNGLTYQYDSEKGTITISPGRALTKSGSMIEELDTKEFAYYVDREHYVDDGLSNTSLEGIDFVLLESKQTDYCKELKEFVGIEKYLLGLQVVYKEERNEVCTPQSCSNQGAKVVIDFVPVLKKANSVEQFRQDASVGAIDELDAPSAFGLADYQVLPVFLRKAAGSFYERIEAVKKGLEAIGKISFKDIQWYDTLFGEDASLKEVLGASVEKLDAISFDNKKITTYFSFADDVHKAVSEFVAFYNDFLSRYRLTLGNRLEEIVILGEMKAADDLSADEMRYTLMETYREYDRSKEERILVRLLKRIVLMIDGFAPDGVVEVDKDFCFVPSYVVEKLGEREIPYYYQNRVELGEYWDAHNDHHVETKTNSNLAMADFNKADLYRLNFDQANADLLKSSLRRQAKTKNLPVIILQYELEGDDVSYCLESYKTKAQGQEVPLDGEAISRPIFNKNLINSSDQNKVINAFNGLWAYYPKFDVEKAAQSIASLRESLIEEIRQSIYLLTKEDELKVGEKKAMEFIMLAILYHRVKKGNLLNPVNMPGTDFVGGVEKRDVLLLVTHHGKVLTCLNMPYLSLILNEAMFRNQLDEYYKEEKESDLQAIFNPQSIGSGSNLIEPVKEGYDLFMLRYGRNKEHTANYLRERGKITFRKAMDMVNSLPRLIFNTETWEEAYRICFVLNERLKSNVLIVPAGMAKTDANGKLTDFIPEKFDIKVTLFEEGKAENLDTKQRAQKAVEKLKIKLPSLKKSIEASEDPSDLQAVWMRDLTSEMLKIEKLVKLDMDAVFEFYPVSK